MLFENIRQRIGFDSDRMMVTQCGNDYHDYSDNNLAFIYVKWADEHCTDVCRLKLTRAEFTFIFTNVSPSVNRKSGRFGIRCVIPIPEYELAMRKVDAAKVL